MQRPSSLHGRRALLELCQESLFPLQLCTCQELSAKQKVPSIHPPRANIQPPPVFIHESQISSSKVSKEAIAFGSAITNFFLNKNWKTLANCSLNTQSFHMHQVPCSIHHVCGKAEFHPHPRKKEVTKGTSFSPCPPPPKHLEIKDKVKMSCSNLSNR